MNNGIHYCTGQNTADNFDSRHVSWIDHDPVAARCIPICGTTRPGDATHWLMKVTCGDCLALLPKRPMEAVHG